MKITKLFWDHPLADYEDVEIKSQLLTTKQASSVRGEYAKYGDGILWQAYDEDGERVDSGLVPPGTNCEYYARVETEASVLAYESEHGRAVAVV